MLESKNTPGGASPAPETVHKSRSKAYRRAYHRAHYATVSACITRPEKEAFKEACRRQNRTQHEVIAELVADWMVMEGVFEYAANKAPAIDPATNNTPTDPNHAPTIAQ